MLPGMTMVLRAARSFDGVADRLSGPTQVVVDAGTILEVGPPTAVASDVVVHDLGDTTLLPGLVDAHVHLTWDASAQAVARVSAADDDALLRQAEAAAASALAVGITTVRDLGDRDYAAVRLRDRLRADPCGGPEIVAAGPPITIRGGHCGFLGGEAESTDELRAAVQDHVERGVDVIKVMATGGEMTPGGKRSHESQYELAQLRMLVEAAHAAGVPLAAHAHGAQGAIDAVTAGFDTIEHGGFWTETGADVPHGVIEQMLQLGTFVVATPAGRGLPDPSQMPRGVAVRLTAILAVVGRIWTAGVPVAYASDAGIAPGKEHDVLVHSLPRALLVAPDAATALRAMTADAAAACMVGHRKGRLAVGYDADLLVVSGNPFVSADDLAKTHTVVRAGRIVRSPVAVTAVPEQSSSAAEQASVTG
jgi:imidazolonepropionase-like amidohydrolase